MNLPDTLPILESLFLVERSNQIYKVKGKDFLNKVKTGDIIHVQRNEEDYYCTYVTAGKWKNLEDDDLISAEYEKRTYHVKASDFHLLFPVGALEAKLSSSKETNKNDFYYRNGDTARITIESSGGWNHRLTTQDFYGSDHYTGPLKYLLPSPNSLEEDRNGANQLSNVPANGYILHKPHSSNYTQRSTYRYRLIVEGPKGSVETTMEINWRP